MKKKRDLWEFSIPINENLFKGLRIAFLLFAINVLSVLIIPANVSGTEPQQSTITGQVTDAQGQPLPGVNVLLRGTVIGSMTDVQGRYRINAPDLKGTLVFTFIGYVAQEIPVNGRTSINVTLVEETTALDEVVVTALGIKREAKSLGYSTSTVDMAVLADNRFTNFGNSLQGKFSGVNVSEAITGAGGSSKIRIRAQSSFGGDNSPLIVVNGLQLIM